MIKPLHLPAALTPFEAQYLTRLNRLALRFLALHVPALALVAAVHGTGVLQALLSSAFVALGPIAASQWLENRRHQSVVLGMAAMGMASLLVHFGQGAMQIEMHFYYFVLLALESVFGNPMVIIASAAVVAAHHVALFFLWPASVFNYDATLWTVVVHGVFVALCSVASIYVSRETFDNVIGLERAVAARTAELADRSRAMRVLLDHVADGFATMDRSGKLAPERSARFDAWFPGPEDATLFARFAGRDPRFAAASELGWSEVVDDVMPREVALAQMPARITVEGRILEVGYDPIADRAGIDATLVVIRDVTDAVAASRGQRSDVEAAQLLDRAQDDPEGFLGVLESMSAVERTFGEPDADASALLRVVHTLKGNAALYGLSSVADACHRIEDHVTEVGELPPAYLVAELRQQWTEATRLAGPLLLRRRTHVELDRATYDRVLAALARRIDTGDLLATLRAIPMVPMRAKLEQLAGGARQIAEALGKEIDVDVVDEGLRLDPIHWGELWNALVHPVRNAVYHGIEPVEERVRRGKPSRGRLTLRALVDGPELVLEVTDDGSGIDWDRLRAAAAARGLDSSSELGLLGLALSTADAVGAVSGRGVGVDALARAVAAKGGRLEIDSERGRGATIRARVPLTEPTGVPSLRVAR